MFVASCAKKPVAPPAAAAPKYPDFVFPAPPAGLGTPATLERHQAGWQWLQYGDVRAAERNFNASLKLTPGFYPAETGLGYSALARKDDNAALQHFDKAIVANPRYAPALVGMGDALLSMGKRDDALKSFESAVAIDPTLASLKSRIEVLRFRGLQDDVAAARKAVEAGRAGEARQLYQSAIKASPQSAFLYRELAALERKENDLPAALVHAQKAAELEPGDARTQVLVGEILEARGSLDGAIQAFSAALALEPNPELSARLDALREKAALAAMPAEYRSIDTAATITRAQLAALIAVRLDPLVKRAAPRVTGVITDTRGNWAAPWILSVTRAGIMEVYANHTFQPSSTVRRSDLARAASQVLSLIAAERPALAASWREANRRRFSDVSPAHLSYPSVSLVVEAGVMSTTPDGSFQLARPATGAEAAAAIGKLTELSGARAQ